MDPQNYRQEYSRYKPSPRRNAKGNMQQEYRSVKPLECEFGLEIVGWQRAWWGIGGSTEVCVEGDASGAASAI